MTSRENDLSVIWQPMAFTVDARIMLPVAPLSIVIRTGRVVLIENVKVRGLTNLNMSCR